MTDAKHQISAVRRSVGDRVLEAGEARVLTISQVYDTDLDDLWEAVTSAERIPRWFLPITGDLTVGGRYQLEGNAGGTVTRCDKPHSYAATWEFGDQLSWIEVRLSDAGNGRSRFELEHVAHIADEFAEKYGPGAVGIGWDLSLLGLANHLGARDATLEPQAAPAWVGSPEGKEFMHLSSDAWADADIASGTEAQHARKLADNTYAFYTGAEH